MNAGQWQVVFYALAFFLNAGALLYAVLNDQYLYAGAFAFVLVYLAFRYRTRDRFGIGKAQ